MADGVDRREFFRPSGIARAVSDLHEALVGSVEKLERLADRPVVRMRRPAMACMIELQFPCNQDDRKTALAALDEIDRLEEQMTIYRADSELSEINRAGFPGPVTVEPRLFSLLLRCRELSRLTAGAFDVTAGPLIRAWGFYRGQGCLPNADKLAEARAAVGIDHIDFDEATHRLRFVRPGVEINLGSIGKGFALDEAAGVLRRGGFRTALLSAGHSSVLAVGKPNWDECWRIDLAGPIDLGQRYATVRLNDRALSTSGGSQRSFEANGRRYSHVLDPRTGLSASGMLQATAVAPDAAFAEALSTAFFIQGRAWTEEFCKSHPEVGAVLVPEAPPGRRWTPCLVGNIDANVVGACNE
jgi:thiamine biosynthesis lipoprotein